MYVKDTQRFRLSSSVPQPIDVFSKAEFSLSASFADKSNAALE